MAPRAHHRLALSDPGETARDHRLGSEFAVFDPTNESGCGEAVRFGMRHGCIPWAILAALSTHIRTPRACPNLTRKPAQLRVSFARGARDRPAVHAGIAVLEAGGDFASLERTATELTAVALSIKCV